MLKAHDADVIEEEPLKPLPSYAWQYRPEYQFSQISLEVESILREYTDESGTKHEQELITEQQGEGKIPTIRSDDDLVSIFYSLVMPQIPRLTAIDGEQELVFSLGAQEVKAVVSENGQVKFDQLAQIDWLDPSDFLTIRLYLNHDAGNTLWEWAFTRNGLHVYFQVPGNGETRNSLPADDIEILSLLESGESFSGGESPSTKVPEPIVRTLGGMRLRYRYIQPSTPGLVMKKVTWTIHHDGRYCWQYGIDPASCQIYKAGQPFVQTPFQLPGIPNDYSVYWEPTDGSTNTSKTLWSNWAGTETNAEGVKANLHAEYVLVTKHPVEPNSTIEVPKEYKKDFTIKTRELKPETDADKVMVGSDVQILEAMLWAFGVSPQYGFPGKDGSRIDQIPVTKLNDGTSIEHERKRNEFSTGWEYLSTTPHKKAGVVDNDILSKKRNGTIEMMVRRFKGRHFYSEPREGNLAAGKNETANVDDSTLEKLNILWQKYLPATKAAPKDVVLTKDSSALQAAVSVWEDGLGNNVPKSYTDDIHKTVLAATGNSGDDFKREMLLFRWAQRESGGSEGPIHWKNYRINEGSGDEFASYSYSQIKFYYSYGTPGAPAHKDNGLNYFKPDDSLKGFAVHTASKSGGIDGGMYHAFSKKDLAKKYNSANGLRGYRHCKDNCATTAILPINEDEKDDNYELLARAITYHHLPGNAKIRSWPDMLVAQSPGCKLCGPEYALDIRINRFGLTPRQYIWFGGVEPDRLPVLDEEGNQVEIEGVPQTIENPKAGQDWCFAFGEWEWLNPDEFTSGGKKFVGGFSDYKGRALDDDKYHISCE